MQPSCPLIYLIPDESNRDLGPEASLLAKYVKDLAIRKPSNCCNDLGLRTRKVFDDDLIDVREMRLKLHGFAHSFGISLH